MKAPFDQLLVAPDPARLREVLKAAAQHLAPRGSQFQADHLFDRILGSVQAEPNGKDVFLRSAGGQRGERYCGMAWWSDHHGRRHVRVFGGNTADRGVHPHLGPPDDDPRSPLWHVYPGRSFRVERLGRRVTTLVSCACGATGAPAALAWMGTRCGPCHDRREEGDLTLAEPHAVLETGDAVYGVAVSPDGNRIATGQIIQGLVLQDLWGGQQILHPGEGGPYSSVGRFDCRTLAFSHDGSTLAVGCPDEGMVWLWSVGTGGGPVVLSFYGPGGYRQSVTGLAFSPSGGLLAASTEGGSFAAWGRGDDWRHAYEEWEGVTSFAFLPHGRSIALGGRHGVVRMLDVRSWAERKRFAVAAVRDEAVLFLDVTSDGRWLVILTGNPDVGGEDHKLRRWDLHQGGETHSHRLPPSSHVALSPDGRYLARTHHDLQHSPAAVHIWDVERWQAAGSLEWDTEDAIYALAFSPDGHTLAVGTQRGRVVLFPWRLLLEA